MRKHVFKVAWAYNTASGRTNQARPIKYLVPVAKNQATLQAKKEAARTAPQQIKKRPQRGLSFSAVRPTRQPPAPQATLRGVASENPKRERFSVFARLLPQPNYVLV